MFFRNKERQWFREQVDYYKRQMKAAYEINGHTDAKYHALLQEHEELQILYAHTRNELSRAVAKINMIEKPEIEKKINQVIKEEKRLLDRLADYDNPGKKQVKVDLSKEDRRNIKKNCEKLTRDIRHYQVAGTLDGEEVEVVLTFY